MEKRVAVLFDKEKRRDISKKSFRAISTQASEDRWIAIYPLHNKIQYWAFMHTLTHNVAASRTCKMPFAPVAKKYTDQSSFRSDSDDSQCYCKWANIRSCVHDDGSHCHSVCCKGMKKLRRLYFAKYRKKRIERRRHG